MTEPREDIADESKSRERFEKAAQQALAYPQECRHNQESWYCDACKYAWEKSLMKRVADALAAAERDTRERCGQTYEELIADRCTDFRMIAEAIRKGGE